MIDLGATFLRLGLALALGLLAGVERERSGHRLAGLRTFALTALLGAVTGLAGRELGPWLPAAGFLAVLGVIATGNLLEQRLDTPDPGQTTAIALLLTYALGLYVVLGEVRVAVVVGGAMMVLLQMKKPLHSLVERLGEEDLRAIGRFVLVSLVILPVLPHRTFGPYDVLDPFEIWLMVVLIVGINLAGYLAYRFFGADRGALLGGILGGLVSSTATTAAYARRSTTTSRLERTAATVIALAGATVLVRVLIELAVVAPSLARTAAAPVGLLLAVFVGSGLFLWRRDRNGSEQPVEVANPTQLGTALLFALLYAVVLVAVAAAREHLGAGGLYGVAILSGLTDVNAITLSTAQLAARGRLPLDTGWRLVVIAVLSNLVFKGGIVALLGTRRLLVRVAAVFAVVLVAGLGILFFWP